MKESAKSAGSFLLGSMILAAHDRCFRTGHQRWGLAKRKDITLSFHCIRDRILDSCLDRATFDLFQEDTECRRKLVLVMSYLFGLSLWVWGLLVTYGFWGGIGSFHRHPLAWDWSRRHRITGRSISRPMAHNSWIDCMHRI